MSLWFFKGLSRAYEQTGDRDEAVHRRHGHRTNSFVPFPTGEAGFAATLALGRQASRAPDAIFNAPLIEWRRLAETDGHRVVESFFAAAQPSGTIVRVVYERIRDMILADLAAALPVDIV